jgi:hypothetical protein
MYMRVSDCATGQEVGCDINYSPRQASVDYVVYGGETVYVFLDVEPPVTGDGTGRFICTLY